MEVIMSQTATELRVVLANTFAMYSKAHSHHWNVTGILFHALHIFLDDLYNELFDAVDPTAEQIRALDEMAPGSLAALLAPATVSYSDSVIPGTPREMIEQLLSFNNAVLESLYSAHDAAESEQHDGVVNFIEDRIDKHAKIGWKLKAHLQ
jgi:starvation-inducible DNA-binding protein